MRSRNITILVAGILIVLGLIATEQVFTKGKAAQGSNTSIISTSAGSAAPKETPNPKTLATKIPSSTTNPSSSCASSANPSGSYTVTLCFTTPESGSVVNGAVSINASVNISGKNPGISRVEFFSNDKGLISDFQSPFTFLLPSTKWQDGTYNISATAIMHDGYTTANKASISLTFDNGINQVPTNSNTFTPTSGTSPASGTPFIVVATGDGADGATDNAKVTNEISSLNPNLFLYLGDVYESGTVAEFYNWYGTGSTSYSKFKAITDPTVGNHEYLTTSAAGYFDYWNNIPSYYSFTAGGWHFISLNSNTSHIGTSSSSAQYAWLQQDLAANSKLCTIVFYHHPLFNIGPEGSAKGMTDIWALMAKYSVSIVINGHDHDYQRWVPLDATGQPDPNGITEFVAGVGGHGLQKITKTDSRVAYSNDLNPQAFGVLELSLTSNKAAYNYVNSTGSKLDTGVITCNK
jgi:hypothetical protein